MSNQLASLRDITTVVADTGDIDAIKKYQPVDATTNPSLLLKAASLPQYASLIDDAVAWAKLQSNDSEQQLTDAADKLSVAIGKEISSTIPGRISTEVDARLSFDKAATHKRPRRAPTKTPRNSKPRSARAPCGRRAAASPEYYPPI